MVMRINDIHRIFIVGCSRSGTSIVQRYLSQKLVLYTLPETDFFNIAASGGILRQALIYLGLANNRSDQALTKLNKLLDADYINSAHASSKFFKIYADSFTKTLDSLSIKKEANGWIEKSPKHFKKIYLIEKFVPNPKFVHVVRYGPNVVASIVDRAYRYKDHFLKQKHHDYAIDLWNKSIKSALKNSGKPNHIVIHYEDFCDDPESTASNIAKKFQLESDKNYSELFSFEKIVLSNELWKNDVFLPIQKRSSKFSSIFTDQEKNKILSKLDMKRYNQLT